MRDSSVPSTPCEGYIWVADELVRCSRTLGHRGQHFGNVYRGIGGTVQWSDKRASR